MAKEKLIKNKGKTAAKKPPIKSEVLRDDLKLRYDTGESEMVVPVEVAKGEAPKKRLEVGVEGGARWDIFFAYFFSWLGGAVLYLIAKDDETRWHGFHAIVLGIVDAILWFTFILGPLMWLYMLYVGWKGANGERVEVPALTQLTDENFDKFKEAIKPSS